MQGNSQAMYGVRDIYVTMTSWASAPRFHLFGQAHKVEGIQGRCGSSTTLHQCLLCYVQHHQS